ncbi:hypothetical protein [Bacillus dakarensis]|uniref:hypothetical protein n=1 Tax=Robertmurraya dakarensis TaxID=1926278 RepID=UPI000980AB6A|nr:hypothetical protein [Bacillus dakarensis]
MTRRNWTIEEIEFLKENLGFMKIPTIANRLNRTESSVLVKMKRLGLSNTKSFTGLLTMNELAKLLKVDSKSVKLWIEHHGLKCSKKVTRSIKAFYFISAEDFWEWAYYNKDRMDFSKIERHTILPEPGWVEQERLYNRNTNYKTWTVNEVRIMMELVSSGRTLSDVGKKLDRSPLSIKRKYDRILKMKEIASNHEAF